MIKRLYRFIFFYVLLVSSTSVYAQPVDIIDSIAEKIEWYALQKPSTTLFVHFDKNIYTNNENVWFTSYLLNSRTRDLHHTLSVALIRNDDRSILAEGKYQLQKLTAFGNLSLPDSLPTGNYTFVCYTNHLIDGFPSALFMQPITIKTANTAGFIANLSLAEDIKPGVDTANVLLKAYTPDIKLVKGAAVTWFIGDRSKPFKTGKLKTDNYGEATIPVPLNQITAANNILQAEINNGKESKTFSIKLPVYRKETFVKFYPEGGSLVAGTKNNVGWEARNNEGDALMVNAVLYQDEQPLQTIQTNAYGMGKFSLTLKPTSRYYVKIEGVEKTNAFPLPTPLTEGPVINIVNALASDTLVIQMNNQQAASNWQVMIHNYRATFVTSNVFSRRRSLVVKIPLAEVPAGLNTVTLLDSVGKPWAERMFFAHYDKKSFIQITTDSASYLSRQKVSLKFKVTDALQNPLTSIVSVACAQDNRFDVKKMTDIESYNFLHAELAAIPFKNRLMGNHVEDKEFLENLLLVKGWRKYSWPEMEKLKASDTAKQTALLTVTGATLMNNKALKKPVQLNIIKVKAGAISSLDFAVTDSAGKFELDAEQLFSEPNSQVQLRVNSKQRDEYSIKVNDGYEALNKQLAGTLLFDNYNVQSFKQTTETVVLKTSEGGKQLLDVMVVAKKDNSIFSSRRGPNACGDYVCLRGILNCTNHMFDGYAPVIGQRYSKRFGGDALTTFTYTGCEALKNEANLDKEKQASLSSFYAVKEFYVPDYSKVDANDPQYASTVYWNYSILTTPGKESEITFYTSDIAGKFRIVIQGVTSNNVVYGEHFFEVRKQ